MTVRGIERKKFADKVENFSRKIQVGARGQKIGPDWTAIDKFDTGPLIDENVDLHDLPYDDCSVDCYVCNAVLEHVFEPQLAIFEMYRTLKVGGFIWVEVPFNQFYHAHPHDFRRWTTQGLSWEMYRFKQHGAGVAADFVREIRHIARVIQAESKIDPIPDEALDAMEKRIAHYSNTTRLLRLYSGCFFWGEKTEHKIDAIDIEFMSRLRRRVVAATHLPARSALLAQQ
ncbi:methyltransferase domain-containing protein [Mesorhizobium sp. RMAD-H1]|uniref:methyltransferase domain-containing protein n=1 Tax=Mesorhizobium sp. RMAD-H1 TaxID=2587065 RepID=UPI0016198B50|nr:methyltransferase domain-containing protein [Mesorhizobium sp. RMAD-H1]MBB2973935.1 SAM-dependent methyltransferase [Mesorhizobium sp. RMAD-H1]